MSAVRASKPRLKLYSACLMSSLVLLSGSIPRLAHADTVNEDDAQSAPVISAPATTTTPPPSSDASAICTDRPTKSNAACTVDAGHWQYESDLFNAAFLHSGGTTTDTYLITNPTLKYGLSKTLDIEVNIAPYEVVRTRGDGKTSTLDGVGDLYFRLKYNFYNSADGKLSVSVIPYVKAPTARDGIGDGAVEGGGLVPVSYKLTDKLTLLTVPEVDDLKNSIGQGRHVNTAQLINLGYTLPYNLEIYGELWGDWDFDPLKTTRQYSADTAVQWGLNNNLQFDVGLNFGLNRETPGVQLYTGISQKF